MLKSILMIGSVMIAAPAIAQDAQDAPAAQTTATVLGHGKDPLHVQLPAPGAKAPLRGGRGLSDQTVGQIVEAFGPGQRTSDLGGLVEPAGQ